MQFKNIIKTIGCLLLSVLIINGGQVSANNKTAKKPVHISLSKKSQSNVQNSQSAQDDQTGQNDQTKKIGYGDYKKARLQNGQTVCEPLDSEGQTFQCYYFNKFDYQVNKETDSQGILKAKSVGLQQNAFTNAEVFDLVTQKEQKDFTTNQQPFSFYVKVSWEGSKAGLGLPLKNENVIQGKVQFNQDSQKYEIKIERVPDLMIGDFFMPNSDIAEIFGRNAALEPDLLKDEMMEWFTKLIAPPVEDYLNKNSDEKLP